MSHPLQKPTHPLQAKNFFHPVLFSCPPASERSMYDDILTRRFLHNMKVMWFLFTLSTYVRVSELQCQSLQWVHKCTSDPCSRRPETSAILNFAGWWYIQGDKTHDVPICIFQSFFSRSTHQTGLIWERPGIQGFSSSKPCLACSCSCASHPLTLWFWSSLRL